MSDHRDTDERLKCRLNGDQVGRERMCIAIMAMQRQYSRVEPRRPEGGPDGSRDIQAVLDGSVTVWGAVGFQNSVTDSPEDKRNAKKKFRDDLTAALTASPKLTAFVFFTNVDLTPGEQDELRDTAAMNGIVHVDIYWRERLRLALDSPQGLGLRYTYLQLPLTDAEQAAFFSTYGKQLEEMIGQQQEDIKRLEFLHWMARPVSQLSVTATLRKPMTADELGHFRFIAKLFTVPEMDDRGWYIGGSDYHHRLRPSDPARCGVTTVFSHSDPPKLEVVKGGQFLPEKYRQLNFGIQFGPGTMMTPDSFNGWLVRWFMTRNLGEAIDLMSLHMNGYRLVHTRLHKPRRHPFHLVWPEPDPTDTPLPEWVDDDAMQRQIDLSYTSPKAE